jgi:TetR/AcrR family transcriptional regulator, cholesterol catabolism regulator
MVQTARETQGPRSIRPRGRDGDRRREILDAASRVFLEKGVHAAGMRDIAAELGMAVGNLYYYFEDKEDLLAFVQEDALSGLLAFADRVRGLDLPADARLQLLVVGHVVRLNDAREGTPGSLAHLELEILSEPRRQGIQILRDRYERRFRELLEEGAAKGELRPADPGIGARLILGALNWTARWFRPGGAKSAREIGEEAATLLVSGLLPPGRALARADAAALERCLKPAEEARP